MRMMVKWEVNLRCHGWVLNLISTNYPDHGHHGRLPLSRKNAHGRAGNWTRDLMVSSQELWPPSHEAKKCIVIHFCMLRRRRKTRCKMWLKTGVTKCMLLSIAWADNCYVMDQELICYTTSSVISIITRGRHWAVSGTGCTHLIT